MMAVGGFRCVSQLIIRDYIQRVLDIDTKFVWYRTSVTDGVRGSVPGLGGLKETKNVSSPSTCES